VSCFCSGPTHRSDDHDGVKDKTFPKDTSLLAGGRQDLVRIEEFQGKIAAARTAGRECDLLVVARSEALIADLGLEEALRRAHAHSEAEPIRSLFTPSKKYRRS
jgi:phosphoenolpyruvate phosphomutase